MGSVLPATTQLRKELLGNQVLWVAFRLLYALPFWPF
jgi:hypothetical protein